LLLFSTHRLVTNAQNAHLGPWMKYTEAKSQINSAKPMSENSATVNCLLTRCLCWKLDWARWDNVSKTVVCSKKKRWDRVTVDRSNARSQEFQLQESSKPAPSRSPTPPVSLNRNFCFSLNRGLLAARIHLKDHMKRVVISVFQLSRNVFGDFPCHWHQTSFPFQVGLFCLSYVFQSIVTSGVVAPWPEMCSCVLANSGKMIKT
jgi:hypothetical protein